MRKLVAVLVMVASACTVAADSQSFDSLEAARASMDRAMQLVVKNDIVGAYAEMRRYWPIPSGEIDTIVAKTVDQRKKVALRFGKIVGYEFVKEQKIGDFLVRYVYVEKREVHAIRWVFVLYKSSDSWIFNAIFWDDNLPALFDM